MRDFELELNQLANGETESLEVSRDEFMVFREIWAKHPERKKVVGEAGLNGRILYRYLPKISE